MVITVAGFIVTVMRVIFDYLYKRKRVEFERLKLERQQFIEFLEKHRKNFAEGNFGQGENIKHGKKNKEVVLKNLRRIVLSP